MSERVWGWAFRNHLGVFLLLIFSMPLVAIKLAPRFFDVIAPMPFMSVFFGAALAGALGFHIGAYGLTVDAIRREGGLTVEKNPISRFLLGRLGFRRTFWFQNGLLIVVMTAYAVTAPAPGLVLLFEPIFVAINFLDWANDKVAIGSVNYFLAHKTHGLPARLYLPCPALKSEDIDEYTIRKLWS